MMNFHQWMAIVENIVWKTVDCSVRDLPDCLFRDWYEDGLTPDEAAERAIKEARR